MSWFRILPASCYRYARPLVGRPWNQPGLTEVGISVSMPGIGAPLVKAVPRSIRKSPEVGATGIQTLDVVEDARPLPGGGPRVGPLAGLVHRDRHCCWRVGCGG